MISYQYLSSDECKDLLCYYPTHDDKRKAIALAGQQRTLIENNYYGYPLKAGQIGYRSGTLKS